MQWDGACYGWGNYCASVVETPEHFVVKDKSSGTARLWERVVKVAVKTNSLNSRQAPQLADPVSFCPCIHKYLIHPPFLDDALHVNCVKHAVSRRFSDRSSAQYSRPFGKRFSAH